MPLFVEITVWTRAVGHLVTHYQGNGFHIKDVNIKGKATKRMKKVLGIIIWTLRRLKMVLKKVEDDI